METVDAVSSIIVRKQKRKHKPDNIKKHNVVSVGVDDNTYRWLERATRLGCTTISKLMRQIILERAGQELLKETSDATPTISVPVDRPVDAARTPKRGRKLAVRGDS